MAIFLGLLAAGMADSLRDRRAGASSDLLVHGGVPALRGIGLMSWG